MKNRVSDKKLDVSCDVPGVNRRNTEVSPDDTVSSKNQKGRDLKDQKGNRQSKTMIDGAEGENV